MRHARPDPALRATITRATPLSARDVTVRAGSGLVRVDGRLLAIQDDAWEGVWIVPATTVLERVALGGDGAALPKARKPDFEAVFPAGGALYVLGSGATARRSSVVRLEPASGAAAVIAAGVLYEAVAAALKGTPNIEGAVLAGDTVRLFNRGAGGVPNAVLDVAFEDFRHGTGPVRSVAAWDLGDIGGIPLTFTDAVSFGGRVLYLAAAENTPDAVADGPVVGAAVGILDGETARWTLLREADGSPSRRKVEGLALDEDGRAGWLLTDPDDAAQPAELCRLEIAG